MLHIENTISFLNHFHSLSKDFIFWKMSLCLHFHSSSSSSSSILPDAWKQLHVLSLSLVFLFCMVCPMRHADIIRCWKPRVLEAWHTVRQVSPYESFFWNKVENYELFLKSWHCPRNNTFKSFQGFCLQLYQYPMYSLRPKLLKWLSLDAVCSLNNLS